MTTAPAALVASAVKLLCDAITGLVVSDTVIVKVVDVAVLPLASVALHVTVVSAIGNVLLDNGVHVATPAPSTASDVVGGV
jgi:hypothetical protein